MTRTGLACNEIRHAAREGHALESVAPLGRAPHYSPSSLPARQCKSQWRLSVPATWFLGSVALAGVACPEFGGGKPFFAKIGFRAILVPCLTKLRRTGRSHRAAGAAARDPARQRLRSPIPRSSSNGCARWTPTRPNVTANAPGNERFQNRRRLFSRHDHRRATPAPCLSARSADVTQ